MDETAGLLCSESLGVIEEELFRISGRPFPCPPFPRNLGFCEEEEEDVYGDRVLSPLPLGPA